MAYLQRTAPNDQTWAQALQGAEPKADASGFLCGRWGQCLVNAVKFEHHHPDWARGGGKGSDEELAGFNEDSGPAGQVIDFLISNGHQDFEDAASRLEEHTHAALNDHDGNLPAWEDGDPSVWKQCAEDPETHHEEVAHMLGETWWLCVNPLICGGMGFNSCADPFYLSEVKCCCCEASTHTTSCYSNEGCCFSLDKCLCCVEHCACPPGGGPDDGVPTCACCNQRCGGEDDTDFEPEDNIMGHAFILFYFGCYGVGIGSCADPLITKRWKVCCLRGFAGTTTCCPEDRGWCYEYNKCFCCVDVRTFPPCMGSDHDGIPTCACCGSGSEHVE